MNRVKRTCRVCGVQYEACATPGRGTFRWQDVACCKEHWELYHQQIIESRKQTAEVEKTEK